jgi:hypothetical protein
MSWIAKLIGGLVLGAIAFGLVHGPSSSCWLSGWRRPAARDRPACGSSLCPRQNSPSAGRKASGLIHSGDSQILNNFGGLPQSAAGGYGRCGRQFWSGCSSRTPNGPRLHRRRRCRRTSGTEGRIPAAPPKAAARATRVVAQQAAVKEVKRQLQRVAR